MNHFYGVSLKRFSISRRRINTQNPKHVHQNNFLYDTASQFALKSFCWRFPVLSAYGCAGEHLSVSTVPTSFNIQCFYQNVYHQHTQFPEGLWSWSRRTGKMQMLFSGTFDIQSKCWTDILYLVASIIVKLLYWTINPRLWCSVYQSIVTSCLHLQIAPASEDLGSRLHILHTAPLIKVVKFLSAMFSPPYEMQLLIRSIWNACCYACSNSICYWKVLLVACCHK